MTMGLGLKTYERMNLEISAQAFGGGGGLPSGIQAALDQATGAAYYTDLGSQIGVTGAMPVSDGGIINITYTITDDETLGPLFGGGGNTQRVTDNEGRSFSTASDVLFTIRATSLVADDAMLIGTVGGSNSNFAGAMADPDSPDTASSPHSGVGSPTYYVNGVEVAGATRGTLFDAVAAACASGDMCVVWIRDVNLSAGNLRIFNSTGNNANTCFYGTKGNYLITDGISVEQAAAAAADLAGIHGFTL